MQGLWIRLLIIALVATVVLADTPLKRNDLNADPPARDREIQAPQDTPSCKVTGGKLQCRDGHEIVLQSDGNQEIIFESRLRSNNGQQPKESELGPGQSKTICRSDNDCFCGSQCIDRQCRRIEAPETCYRPGDIDDDNRVTCADVDCANQLLVGMPPSPRCTQQSCADVDPLGFPDGLVSIGDIVRILSLATQNGYDCRRPDPPDNPSNERQCRFLPHCRDRTDNDRDGLTDYENRGIRADLDCVTPEDDDERNSGRPPVPVPQRQCGDNIDNDGDLHADFDGARGLPPDPGCTDRRDTSERRADVACDDGADNDGDLLIDYGPNPVGNPIHDPDCESPSDSNEGEMPANRERPVCDDDADNDRDSLYDFDGAGRSMPDPGCFSDPLDMNEEDVEPPGATQCSNGADDDTDGLTDAGRDPGCRDRNDNDEQASNIACDDGEDNDRDGSTDTNDEGCIDPWDTDETDPVCNDEADNDGDGLYDADGAGLSGPDLGCNGPHDVSERTGFACDDGVNNDGDDDTDFGADRGCLSIYDVDERLGTQCDNGHDDQDADDLWDDEESNPDGLDDFGCESIFDTSEELSPNGRPQCSNLIDDDADGGTDVGEDVGCDTSLDPNEYGDNECDDSIDNDNDGLLDYRFDPGCTDQADLTENNANIECDDSIDNDADEQIDYPHDRGCATPEDPWEGSWKACDNGRNDDADGLIDAEDPGCIDEWDDAETNDYWECDNMLDDEPDGTVDWPRDAGCSAADDESEAGFQCADGIDNDDDGAIDYVGGPGDEDPDPHCVDESDDTESEITECNDGVNNDHDDRIDFGENADNDPGCSSPDDPTETNPAIECDDDHDNDGDFLYDLDDVPDCFDPLHDDTERPEPQCNDEVDNDLIA